ncbi:sensor histidine kinase [Phenylobacterium sp.]|uniref:sensor histidine kinase n=1 Tax=Phenylobacterium sp. TaxID=1871053 RepID=UPI0011FD7773|nr:PAS domain-containing sensor histidine kinase [Phenylobacterium sp.]THD61474.1 MAG: histidine kinase [Phenylobacterium sp.]
MATPPPITAVVGDNLALALVASSDAPILLLDGDLRVVAASLSFSRAFQVTPDRAANVSLFELGSGEWEVPQLRSLLRATLGGVADIDAYEMDLRRPGREPRRLVLTAHELDYGDAGNRRLLLTISDVTDARLAERLKDDLLREKAILFQELQHRVANSLQIIASVLMQSARRVPSAEIKSHLYDAHNRVMSVAALQHQLAASHTGDVELRPYFTELCESIGASMIPDREKLRLEVEADVATATADVSVSLGLVVTELVINALKHAFPDGRSGRIVVAYEAEAADWRLSVRDDGIGMLTGDAPAKLGLGTSIVQALAAQLGAVVEVAGTDPGTRISLVRSADPPAAEIGKFSVVV